MSVTAAISMGVSAMVGAGIFALLGEAGSMAGNAVYLSFVIAGFISLLSGYSYAKLGVRYPSSGGIVEFLAQAYGSGYLTGVLSIMLYLSVTIVMALVARAFGSYAKALIAPNGPEFWVNSFASAMVIGLTIINAMGSNLVGKVEKFIVLLKVSILHVVRHRGFSAHPTPFAVRFVRSTATPRCRGHRGRLPAGIPRVWSHHEYRGGHAIAVGYPTTGPLLRNRYRDSPVRWSRSGGVR